MFSLGDTNAFSVLAITSQGAFLIYIFPFGAFPICTFHFLQFEGKWKPALSSARVQCFFTVELKKITNLAAIFSSLLTHISGSASKKKKNLKLVLFIGSQQNVEVLKCRFSAKVNTLSLVDVCIPL